MGTEGDTTLAAVQTLIGAKKAFRLEKGATEKNHYMMVSVLPSKYDSAGTAYGSSKSITLTVYKNTWEEMSFTPTTAVAPVSTVSESAQLAGVKLMAGTVAAFAAVAMTLQ